VHVLELVDESAVVVEASTVVTFALSLKPSVAYRVLNFAGCRIIKVHGVLASFVRQ
jgi:hypothetical protein